MCGEPKSKHALIEKRSEIKKRKTVSFNCKYGATLKLKTNRNYSVHERGCSLLSASLFTLNFFIVLKSKVVTKSQTHVSHISQSK